MASTVTRDQLWKAFNQGMDRPPGRFEGDIFWVRFSILEDSLQQDAPLSAPFAGNFEYHWKIGMSSLGTWIDFDPKTGTGNFRGTAVILSIPLPTGFGKVNFAGS